MKKELELELERKYWENDFNEFVRWFTKMEQQTKADIINYVLELIKDGYTLNGIKEDLKKKYLEK